MEYAGYVSRGSIDWSGIAKGLQENVNKGLQERQKKLTRTISYLMILERSLVSMKILKVLLTTQGHIN
jgi:hypothetical protein